MSNHEEERELNAEDSAERTNENNAGKKTGKGRRPRRKKTADTPTESEAAPESKKEAKKTKTPAAPSAKTGRRQRQPRRRKAAETGEDERSLAADTAPSSETPNNVEKPASPITAAASQPLYKPQNTPAPAAVAAPPRRVSSFAEGIFNDSAEETAATSPRSDAERLYDPDDREEKETGQSPPPQLYWQARDTIPDTPEIKRTEMLVAEPESRSSFAEEIESVEDRSDLNEPREIGETEDAAKAADSSTPPRQEPRVIVEHISLPQRQDKRRHDYHDKRRQDRHRRDRDERSAAPHEEQRDQQTPRSNQDNAERSEDDAAAPTLPAATAAENNRQPHPESPGQERQESPAEQSREPRSRRDKRRRGRRKGDRRGSDARNGEIPSAPADMERRTDETTESLQDEERYDSDFQTVEPLHERQAGDTDAEDEDEYEVPTGNAREMLVNTAQDDECRIAVIENGRLEELYIERKGTDSHVGNIYKGRITNVEPSIQACFVDFGIGTNGFLHISDLQSLYFPKSYNNQKERVGCKRPRRDRPPIQDCVRRGQELVVQVTKEGIGTKGPTLTTYLSIPGRFLVLMPGMNRMGISRKIEDEETRQKARGLLQQLSPPKDMGFIIRTAGIDRAKRDLQRDMTYLTRLWETVTKAMQNGPTPCLVYQESDLVIRTIRDIFNSNITKIICDKEETVKKIHDFLSISMPRSKCRVILHDEHQGLFAKYHIEEEIQKIQSRHVPLKSGGSLVIDPTEAIIAIDVNSGKYRVHDDAETTAFRINMEAAPEIARQLRLRDLGGVIIMDFIDMMQEKHRREVERALREAMSQDRARIKVLRMSHFGIIEMTRQRMRPSLKRSTYMDCPHCHGSGLLKTPETASIQVLRQLHSLATRTNIAAIDVSVSADVANFMLNQKRNILTEMEQSHHKQITVLVDKTYSNDMVTFVMRDQRGIVINSQ